MNEYATSFGNSAAEALPAKRAQFIRKTYLLLAVAILAFIGVEAALFVSGASEILVTVMLGRGSIGWLVVLALFMGVSFLANRWGSSETSSATQYIGLAVLVVAYAVLFVPLVYISAYYSDPSVLVKAAIVTMGLFLGITATVFITRSDFSFLGPILAIGGFVALGFIASSAIFGFSLGSIFAFVMVAFAGTAILYNTSNVLHRFGPDQHVAASMTLFASVALLFWYILSIFSSRD